MSLFRTAIGGMAWTTTSTVIRSVVSLLQVSILTSYLSKEDFGIVAICNLFIGFTQIFLDMGISVGILHKQDITKEQFSSLFWFNIFSGVVLTCLLCCISPLVARAYNDTALVNLLVLLSLTVLFSSIGAQHRTVQQKMMRFKFISIIEILTSILTLILAIVLVRHSYGVYALIYSTMFSALFSNIVFLFVGLYKDRNISFHFKLSDTFPFLKIGVFTIGSEVLNYFSREFDILIISASFGKETLGLYSLCKKLIMALYGAINPILTKVITPLLATLQDNINRLRKIYFDLIETLSLINYPIYLLIAIFAYGVLKFLYGEQYVDGMYILSALAIYYGSLTTGNSVGCLQTATGRTDSGFYWNICRIIICAAAVYIGSLFSIEGVVICLYIASVVSSPLSWRITIKPLIGGDFWNYFWITMKPFLFSVLYALPFYYFFCTTDKISHMILISVLYIIVYCLFVILIFRNSYIVKKLYRSLRPNIKV